MEPPFAAEIGAAVDLSRRLGQLLRSLAASDTLPIVLSGNCNSCIGTLSALGQKDLGILWFDAHGDFNTPETTLSGYLDGMALAMASGHCWRALLATVPGFSPVPESRIVLLGLRDANDKEAELLRRSAVTILPAETWKSCPSLSFLEAALKGLRRNRAGKLYLHFDMDVLDCGAAKANAFSTPGGLSLSTALDSIRIIKDRFPLAACCLSAYDPAYDREDAVLNAALGILEEIAR